LEKAHIFYTTIARLDIITMLEGDTFMKRTHATLHTIDPALGRRIFTGCWWCSGLGISILQMLLLAQAWFVSRQAFIPACMASSWMIGSLLGMRLRATARQWAGCLIATTLVFLVGPRLVLWRIAHVPAVLLSDGALLVLALLLGAISTAWLMQPRPWPAAGERAMLARGLIGTTAGLFTVWVFPVWAGLITLTCLIPLLALDCLPAARSPLPPFGSVTENWVSRYWSTEKWQVQLDMRSLPKRWWWSYLVERARDSRGYLQLTLLASSSAVILGAVWGAVPTPFAAGLAGNHELGKLGWLLGGQMIALALGAGWMLVARSVVGFPDRLVPACWHARTFALALPMPVILASSLVTLGVPFLQAPWWLALSIASFTLAGAIWGFLLPRLRPRLSTVVSAQRHRSLGQDMGWTDPLRLAHARAQEARHTQLIATTEGVLIATITLVVGLLIDFYGSVDRVLIIVGQCFLLLLTVWALVCVLRHSDKPQRLPYTRRTFFERPMHLPLTGRSSARLSW
jgi:hypothetical protein